MRIVSHRKLVEFYSSEGHGDAQAALERWYDTAERAQWKNLSDIKVDFPATDKRQSIDEVIEIFNRFERIHMQKENQQLIVR